MSLTIGTSVGRYHVQALLGRGGMGEVYRALDPTLNRPVALKVLRQELGVDPERLSRFLHEARAASALNHPNILTIHEVGDHDGSRFIVSELVDGESVRQRAERGPLTLREILDIGIQTASALAAAHAASIVHRDIKPDNLMLRPDGYVKVLDFGVATFTKPAAGPADLAVTMAPDQTTAPGMVVGTIAYMSPEQARGLPLDGRSDAYSLGVVLYELVTGRAPFVAPTTSDLLVAILEREPPPLRVAARGLPLQLEWIIEKALEKDASLRYQSIADLRVDLLRLKAALDAGRLVTGAIATDALSADRPVEVALTDDSPRVAAISGVSWGTAIGAAVAAAALLAAMFYYHRARLGADLPLELPEGAVLTKARDTIQDLGYTGWGSRSEVEFEGALSTGDVAKLAGLPAARDAIRDGLVARWDVNLTRTGGSSASPAHGDFAVRLDPRGKLVSFTTGAAAEPATPAERDRAAALGLAALQQAYQIDASAYQFEYVQRTIPAGLVEMTWRSPEPKFGHTEQLKVNLHGERAVHLDRSFERPPGYTEPELSWPVRALQISGIFVIAATALVAWAFGLFVLFKTKSWDALTNRLPLAICTLVLVQTALNTIDSSGVWQSVLGVMAMAVLLAGTVLPALSGVLLWMRRRNPARVWAADQLTHGRVFSPTVSISLVEGALAGAAVAAAAVFGDWAALGITGFVPSISREVEAVDAGVLSIVGDTLGAASFLAIGIALAVEAFDWLKLNAWVSTAIVAVGAGLIAANDQVALLPGLPLIAAMAAGVACAVLVYRRRGFLAVWMAALVSGLLTDAMAARALEDPDLLKQSNLIVTLIVALTALGVWGLAGTLFRKAPVATQR